MEILSIAYAFNMYFICLLYKLKILNIINVKLPIKYFEVFD